MQGSLISWTHNTWNPWVGCDKVAPECAKCYIGREIRKQTDWQGDGKPRQAWGEVYLTKTWNDPYKWQKELEGTDNAKRIFTCSLSDFFHAKVDSRKLDSTLKQHLIAGDKGGLYHTHWRGAAWQVIKDTPNLIYLILTKRPERIMKCLPPDWGEGYPNVWLGTSVGTKQRLKNIDALREVPVHPEAVRFISAEPLLEDISEEINLDKIGWLIVGGESGSNPEYLWDAKAKWQDELVGEVGRRTMDVAWARRLQRLAHRAGIPFFFKQVTSGKAGQGEAALGRVYHEFPNPPKGLIWMPEAEIHKPELVVLG